MKTMTWHLFLALFLVPITAFSQDYSLHFEASGRVETPHSPELSPECITAEMWVKLDIPQLTDSSEQMLLKKGSGSEAQYAFFLSRGRPEMSMFFQGGIVVGLQSTVELQPLIWRHLVFAACGDSLRIIVNGQRACSFRAPSVLEGGTGMVFIGGDTVGENFRGSIDGVRISSGARYSGDFDPFTGDMNGILPFDREIPAWHYGLGIFDHMEAGDSTSLYLIIDGAAEIYLEHNFQYAIYQMYYELSGSQRGLSFWLTDQGDSANAAGLYHDHRIAVGEYQLLAGLGDEARIDTSLLFDLALDMHYDRYYLSLTTERGASPQLTVRTLMDFGESAVRAMRFLRAQAADSALALSYLFHEGAGITAYDSSFYGNDGTIIGAEWGDGCDFTYPFYIISAAASDGDVIAPGIDDDDFVTLHFNILFTDPPQITAAALDSTLALSGGHTWLSGAGMTGDISWAESDSGHILKVNLSTGGGSPTIAIGDTVFPNGIFNAAGKEIESLAVIGGAFGPSGMSGPELQPVSIEISPPYPNPFNSSTTFKVKLSGRRESVRFEVFNLMGEKVDNMLFEDISGDFTVRWSSADLPSGIYFARISAGSAGQIRKMVLMK